MSYEKPDLSKKPIGYCLFRNLVDEAEILSLELKSKYRNKRL